MKCTIKGSELTINLGDFVDDLSEEARGELAKHLCGKERLFAAVLECVASDDGSFHEGEWWFGSDRVLELREKLLPLMPEIARAALKLALEQRNQARKDAAEHARFAWNLYRGWPEGVGCKIDPPEFTRRLGVSEEEVDRILSGEVTQ